MTRHSSSTAERSRKARLLSLTPWVFCAVLLVVALAGYRGALAKRVNGPFVPNGDPVARGAYLVTSIGCTDCHTPWIMGANGPEPDATRFLSGHPASFEVTMPELDPNSPWPVYTAATFTAFAGPWGISYAANLTPDENTGLGIWTEEMFVNAIREGRHFGQSRPILPPMPWQALRNLTDDDLKSIYAYLRTIEPISNRVPEPFVPGEADAF